MYRVGKSVSKNIPQSISTSRTITGLCFAILTVSCSVSGSAVSACGSGWTASTGGDYCLKVIRTQKTYNQAKYACEHVEGGKLATMETTAKQIFMTGFLVSQSSGK